MAAVVHASNVGRRAAAGDRKVVFKSVLDNPFRVTWPHVPLNIQNTALAALVNVLAGVSEYHLARQNANRKRKRAQHDKSKKDKANSRKKRKLDVESAGNDTHAEPNAIEEDGTVLNSEPTAMELDTMDASDEPLPPPPPVFSHLTFGINEVTKRLEAQSASLRPRVTVLPPETTPAAGQFSPPPLTHVFVCRADVDPPLLIAHLPELVAACNAPSPSTPPLPVLLIPFPQYAEQTLAATLGMRRVSVLALDSTTPSLETLRSLLASIQPPSAPWLTARTTSHVPTHIKQLSTTAPRDMRAAKRERTESRHAAKQKKNEKRKGKNGQGTEKTKEGDSNNTIDGNQKEVRNDGKGKEKMKGSGKNNHGKEKAPKKSKIKITAHAPTQPMDLLPA